jgi:hypothetical protein
MDNPWNPKTIQVTEIVDSGGLEGLDDHEGRDQPWLTLCQDTRLSCRWILSLSWDHDGRTCLYSTTYLRNVIYYILHTRPLLTSDHP